MDELHVAAPAIGHNLLRFRKKDLLKPLKEEQNPNGRTTYFHYPCTWLVFRNIPYVAPVAGHVKVPKRTLYHFLARVAQDAREEEFLVWVYNLNRGNYYVREVTGDPERLIKLMQTIHRLDDYLPGIEDFHNTYRAKRTVL